MFLRHDPHPVVRSHAAASAQRHVPLAGGPPPEPAGVLRGVQLPAFESRGWRSDGLLDRVPELRAQLAPHSADPAALLAEILSPGRAGTALHGDHVITEGGKPDLLHDPHGATCPTCKAPMRFLFQFGQFAPVVDVGDAYAYVYGCDAHPEQVWAIVEFA